MSTFADRHGITLRVAGRDYPYWTRAEVSYGIEMMARTAVLDLVRTRVGSSVEDSPVDCYLGDAVEVYVGVGRRKERMITGYVDSIDSNLDARSASVSVVVRSKTADVVDSCVVGKRRFDRMLLGAIILELIEPHGVSATVDGSIGDVVTRFRCDVGERVGDVLQRLAARYGFLIYDDAAGDLVFQRAVSGSFPRSARDVLEVGRNVLTSQSSLQAASVYSEYRCKGQTVGTDAEWADSVVGLEAVARSGAIGRRRVLVLAGGGDSRARCKARAEYEAASRLGRASTLSVTVRGWYRADEQLWKPGTLVKVTAPFHRMDGDLLISSVGLHASSDGGYTTGLSLGPEYGFLAELPEDSKRSIGAWRSPV